MYKKLTEDTIFQILYILHACIGNIFYRLSWNRQAWLYVEKMCGMYKGFPLWLALVCPLLKKRVIWKYSLRAYLLSFYLLTKCSAKGGCRLAVVQPVPTTKGEITKVSFRCLKCEQYIKSWMLRYLSTVFDNVGVFMIKVHREQVLT